MNDKELIFLSLKDKLPNDDLMLFKDKLNAASEAGLERLLFLNLKNPMITLLLSLCFGMFAADRFYKGDVRLGVLKLCVFLAPFVFFFLLGFFASDLTNASDESLALFGASFVFVIFWIFVVLIWAIADIFLCFFGTKKDNLKKVLEVL